MRIVLVSITHKTPQGDWRTRLSKKKNVVSQWLHHEVLSGWYQPAASSWSSVVSCHYLCCTVRAHIQIVQFSHVVSMNLLETTIGERVCIGNVEGGSANRTQICAGVIHHRRLSSSSLLWRWPTFDSLLLRFRCLVSFSSVDSRPATALLKTKHSCRTGFWVVLGLWRSLKFKSPNLVLTCETPDGGLSRKGAVFIGDEDVTEW